MSFPDEYNHNKKCNGRGLAPIKRYLVQSRLLGERWVDVENARFAELQDALDYASMCSCYPVIYGMTRVLSVDEYGARVDVVQTFSAGEGQMQPDVNERQPFSIQLRYTVSPHIETWGWFSKRFSTREDALEFVKRHIFPRKMCDAVRIYHCNKHQVTYYSEEILKYKSIHAVRDEARADRDHRRNDAADVTAYAVHHGKKAAFDESSPMNQSTGWLFESWYENNRTSLPYSIIGTARAAYREGFRQCEVQRSLKGGVRAVVEPGKVKAEVNSIGKDAERFDAWMRERFNAPFNVKIDLHCAMLEAFRAGLQQGGARPHQS